MMIMELNYDSREVGFIYCLVLPWPWILCKHQLAQQLSVFQKFQSRTHDQKLHKLHLFSSGQFTSLFPDFSWWKNPSLTSQVIGQIIGQLCKMIGLHAGLEG